MAEEIESGPVQAVSTTYVVLERMPDSPVAPEPGSPDPDRWVEVGRVTANRRETAYDAVLREYPNVKPQEAGEVGQLQLVPLRFWRPVVMTCEMPEPRVLVEGL